MTRLKMPKLFNGSYPRLKCFILACIFITLGIPLIIYSTRASPLENISQFQINDLLNQTQVNTILNYPDDSVFALGTRYLKLLTCATTNNTNPKCAQLMKDLVQGTCTTAKYGCCIDDLKTKKINSKGSNCGNTADALNSLRMSSFVIGILLLCFAVLKLIECAML